MTDFSPEHASPPRRFRPGPGQGGTEAGIRALKPPPGGGGEGQSGGRRRRAGGQSGGHDLGLPALQAKGPPPADLSPHQVIGHHLNITDLGRETPFGIWFLLNGHARPLFQAAGRAYPDLLELG